MNPDKKILSTVIRGLARNEKKFGKRYCPCRLRPGDKANICTCIYLEAEIAKNGHCKKNGMADVQYDEIEKVVRAVMDNGSHQE